MLRTFCPYRGSKMLDTELPMIQLDIALIDPHCLVNLHLFQTLRSQFEIEAL